MSEEQEDVEFLWPYPKGDSSKVARMVYAVGALGRWYAQQKAGTDALTNLVEKGRFLQVCRRFGHHFNLTEECSDILNIQQVLIKLRKQGALPLCDSIKPGFSGQAWWNEPTPEELECLLSRN
jgi:hypothetical protein